MALVAVTAAYVVIFAWMALSYLRRRDPLLRDAMWMFASVSMLFVLGVLKVFAGPLPPLVTGVFLVLLLAKPVVTLRLVGRLRRMPWWALVAATVAWLASALPLLVSSSPLPRSVVWPAVGVFSALETVAAGLLVAQARRRGGAARTRLWCAAVSTGVFGVALLVSGGGSSSAVHARLLALVSGLLYLLAFVPPVRLRRSWSSGAAYAMSRHMLTAPANAPVAQTWRHYCLGVRRILGSDHVVVLVPTTGGSLRMLTHAEEPVIEREVDDRDVAELLAPPLTIDALVGWTRPPALAVELAGVSGTRFVTATPFRTREGRGALVMLNRYRTLFADDDVALFAELAAHAAALAERAALLAERESLIAQAERDAAERRLQNARRLESLGKLAGGVAHDFNNILAIIGNYTEMLIDTCDGATTLGPDDVAAARDDLDHIRRAAERAAGLTRQLLAFGRRNVRAPQTLGLNHVIGDAEPLLRRTVGDDIHLITQLDRDLWTVRADAGQLEQVLVNLALNARDAMPSGGTVSIDTSNAELGPDDVAGHQVTPGRYARLRFSDTGTGMPPEVMERALEPFFTTKPRGSGTGLGLATVYGVATAAGGDVHLYSEPDLGTTVTILLPATDRPATAGGFADRHGPAVPVGVRTTVLMVEDEDALRQVAGRILTRAGYHVLAANGGPQAIHLAQTHPDPIDLLLTDVIMPHMTGNEVAAAVTAIRPGLPVLYMSGYAEPVLTSTGTLPDDVVMIEKPFTSRELLQRVGDVLRHRPVV